MKIMLYTWNKNFYDNGEEKFSFTEAYTWNKQVFKSKIRLKCYVFINRIASTYRYIMRLRRHEYIVLKLIKMRVALIKFKLQRTGRELIDIEKSPVSNSHYIYYRYESRYRNYIKIRVSDHGATKNDNSNILIFI